MNQNIECGRPMHLHRLSAMPRMTEPRNNAALEQKLWQQDLEKPNP